MNGVTRSYKKIPTTNYRALVAQKSIGPLPSAMAVPARGEKKHRVAQLQLLIYINKTKSC